MTVWNWPELIEEQKQSGKTVSAFCSEKGVHYTSFYKNRKKLQKNNFVEVKPKLPVLQKKTSSFSLHYKDFSLEIESEYDRESLSDLLKILRAL